MSGLVLKPRTILEGRYEVSRPVHEGTKTMVYLGRHLRLGSPVVIKVLREIYPDPIQARQQLEQVQAEAHLYAKLNHPGLVSVHDVFEYEGYPVLVMEQIAGRSLREISSLAPKPISERRVLTWAEQMLDILEFLHGQHPPVIVRNLQPSNVLLDSQGQLRLVELGWAKQMDDKGRGTHEIVKGVGEDGFTPLEQHAFTSTDARSDLYSLGATLYFLLTGTAPPGASRRVIQAEDPLVDPRYVNSSVREGTWKAIQSLMAHRPQGRPDSAAHARDLLGLNGKSRLESEPPVPGVRLCVDCRVELDIVRRYGVEMDQCPRCQGLWLDHGELGDIIDLAVEETRTLDISERQTVPVDPTMMVPLGVTSEEPQETPTTPRRERIRQLLRELFSLR